MVSSPGASGYRIAGSLDAVIKNPAVLLADRPFAWRHPSGCVMRPIAEIDWCGDGSRWWRGGLCRHADRDAYGDDGDCAGLRAGHRFDSADS
jgi:hypothetical protein